MCGQNAPKFEITKVKKLRFTFQRESHLQSEKSIISNSIWRCWGVLGGGEPPVSGVIAKKMRNNKFKTIHYVPEANKLVLSPRSCKLV